MNIGELFVKLSADPSGLNRGVDQAETKLGGMAKTAAKVGGALAAAFAAREAIRFGKDSIATFSEAEAVWNRLSGTLATTGVAFSDVETEIVNAAAAMQKATTVGDEDFAATLQTLVATSGDYAASLREVETVANLAAATQMDLNAAAVIVGKAMVGETATLSRYGIVVGEGADAMEVLREKFAGMATNEANTLQGKTEQLSNAWGDFKEAIGGALLSLGGSGDILGTVTGMIQGMTAWVEKNSDSIQALGKAFMFVAEVVVRTVGAIIETLGLLTGPFNAVKAGVESVTGVFRDMYDKVVGNSYVPDMVDGIQAEFARLQAVMVDPAIRAANQVNLAFASVRGPGAAGAGGGGIGKIIGGVFGAGGALASLNPVTMITGMAMGAVGSMMRGIFSGIGKKLFGFGDSVDQAQKSSKELSDTFRTLNNSVQWFDLALRRRQATAAGVDAGGPASPFTPPRPGDGSRPTGNLVVNINNPPAGFDSTAAARSVKNALLYDPETRAIVQRMAFG